jgi:hypothetical protein
MNWLFDSLLLVPGFPLSHPNQFSLNFTKLKVLLRTRPCSRILGLGKILGSDPFSSLIVVSYEIYIKYQKVAKHFNLFNKN